MTYNSGLTSVTGNVISIPPTLLTHSFTATSNITVPVNTKRTIVSYSLYSNTAANTDIWINISGQRTYIATSSIAKAVFIDNCTIVLDAGDVIQYDEADAADSGSITYYDEAV